MYIETDFERKQYLFDPINNRKYYNRLQMLVHFEPTTKLDFYFQDEFWEGLDWTQEPSDSFDDLLKERAQQIRDKYDYIILYYSGGSDSHTMLMSFLKNNIFIDEIVVSNFYTGGENIIFKDLSLVVIPNLKKMHVLMSKTKITVLNLTPENFDNFITSNKWESSNFTGTLNSFRRLTLDELAQIGVEGTIRDRTRKGHIYAEFKPRIRVEGDDFYYKFSSKNLSIMSPYKELFFTTSDLPDLHLKQCFLVKNYIKKFHPTFQGECLESTPSTRQLLWEACRLPFNQAFQLDKNGGIFGNVDTTIINEESVVLQSLKQDRYNVYDNYINGLLKPILTETNKGLIDLKHKDVISLYKEFHLGT